MTDAPTDASAAVPLVDVRNGSAPVDGVLLPCYDRSRLRPAVVHFGVGGFHRAHQAVYFDQLAGLGFTHWGVIGVGMHRPEMG
ncbi:hypothetical protein K7G98_22345, partial [Saccharothrix sp. MB29]|nr:hypothetical protein [Saccharothrix sp. MB29]